MNRNAPIVISFSGGKDSVATWLWTRSEGFTNVQAVFCNTGHEAAATYQYIEELSRNHGLPLVWVQPKVRDMWLGDPPKSFQGDPDAPLDMERLAILKKRFPSPTARFCTTHLKLIPLKRWIAANAPEDTLLVSGVRAQESDKRAQLAPDHWDEFMERRRLLPIHQWTVEDVFAIHKEFGVPPNPLYKRGAARVGCYPCIMARKPELAETGSRDPAMFDGLLAMERRVAASLKKPVLTFFAAKMVPKKYRSTIDAASGKHVATADDVRRWAQSRTPNYKEGELLFESAQYEDEGEDVFAPACSSPYGLCE